MHKSLSNFHSACPWSFDTEPYTCILNPVCFKQHIDCVIFQSSALVITLDYRFFIQNIQMLQEIMYLHVPYTSPSKVCVISHQNQSSFLMDPKFQASTGSD